MTARWIESFEASRNVNLFARAYDVATGAVGSAHVGSRGGNALNSANIVLRTRELVTPDENTWIVGCMFQVANATLGFASTQNAIPYVSIRNASGEQLRFEFLSDNSPTSKPGGIYYKIRVMRGATVLATSNERFDAREGTKTWVYFEFKATVRTGTNGSFDVRWHSWYQKNQTMTWSAANTGVNTANQAVDGGDRIEFSFNTGTDNDPVAFDEIYIFDGSGATHNDFYGEIYCEAIVPSGNGATLEWSLTGGAASLEDAWNEGATTQSVLEDDKRVTSDTVGQIELAAMTDLNLIQTSMILGVQARVYGKMESSGSRDVEVFYRKTTGSPAQVGGAIGTFSTGSNTAIHDIQVTDPNTGVDWVPADINGLQLGVRLDA